MNNQMHKSGEPSSPAPPDRRVVVTGLGIVNAMGATPEAFWQSLYEGRSGVKTIELFDASKLPTRFASQVSGFNAKNYIEKKERKNLRVMARSIQLAVAGAQLALDDSGIDKSQLDPTRFGVEFGAGLMATELSELAGAAQISVNCKPDNVDMVKWGDDGIPTIPPLWMLKYLPNMLACQVSILHNAQGPNNTITEGDVASLLALGESYRIIQRDQGDYFLTGGADSKINPLSMVRQVLFGALSTRNDEPERASRPFDRDRDGLVVGEGAGVLAIEELSHAQSRNARIYAEIVGFGCAFDVGKNGEGLVRAMQIALSEAGIKAGELDHINAHGLSTQSSDAWEANGIRRFLQDSAVNIPIFAAKSYFGNMGAAGSTSEMAASILAMDRGVLPATLNYENADSNCPIDVNRENKQIAQPYFMKISFTDMGQCAAVVCRKWDG